MKRIKRMARENVYISLRIILYMLFRYYPVITGSYKKYFTAPARIITIFVFDRKLYIIRIKFIAQI